MAAVGRSATRRIAPVRRRIAALVALLAVGQALAYDGVTFGLQVAPPSGEAVPLTANLVLPVHTLHDGAGSPVGLAVRGDVSYAVGAGVGPSAGVNLLLSDAAAGEAFARPYLGFGVALANDGVGLTPTPYGVVGWRAPVAGTFAIRIEGIVNPTVHSAALQLGLDISPWGAR